ncbi:Regulator of nucleoside diphosphate kinase [Aquisphaera giovannonii]|uniref:Regulator of nucleoside diphosphate kinase n=1 Tax=Aquisphaera giovannonii TaxID=406548 RepID=A0A5B9W3N9_9BACT|nr:nucleoside diphosphate kinase regulator [Aquisphaera giovannonii]QEH34721.1 Regulator of nucleoside diphosphate kinase [Aquisphaera giovannonii]
MKTKKKPISITRPDRERLEGLLAGHRGPDLDAYLSALRAELERARVIDADEVPPDVVTMNSTVRLVDVAASEEEEYTLVFPGDADADLGRISVMAPLGTAMLGYRVGDVFEWDVPMGRRRWRVAGVVYQPEAAGHHHL